MRTCQLSLVVTALLFASPLVAEDYPTLEIGSQAPDFNLPGVDGKNYQLADFEQDDALLVIFTCNHCPTAQAYEDRIKKLHTDYGSRGVRLVAISPNDAEAVRLDELGYSDLGDSLEDMKIRAKEAGFEFPYLYDGETQQVTKAYGAKATPHTFLFDKERKLRYTGRIDDGEVGPITKHDLRDAIEAVLRGEEVATASTRVFGCSVKWASKQSGSCRIDSEMGARAGRAGSDRSCGDQISRGQRNRELSTDQSLGDLVRSMRDRAPAACRTQPYVPRPALRADHDLDG